MHEKTGVLQLPDAALMPSPHLSSSEHTLQFMLFQTSGLLTLLVLEKTVLNSFNSELLISFNLVKIFGFIYLRRCCLVHVNFESFSLELLFFLIEVLTRRYFNINISTLCVGGCHFSWHVHLQ